MTWRLVYYFMINSFTVTSEYTTEDDALKAIDNWKKVKANGGSLFADTEMRRAGGHLVEFGSTDIAMAHSVKLNKIS